MRFLDESLARNRFLRLRSALRLAGLSVGFFLAMALPVPAAAAETGILARIKSTGEVRVCIWPEYYSISYRNPRTQQLSGIDVDMALELGAALGTRVRFIDSSFARLIEDVNGDRCDIAMFAIGVTPLRSEKLRFTSPHLASDIYAIASKASRRVQAWGDIDQPGIVVAVAKGTLHEPIMKEKLTKATLAVLDTPFAREQEVESGRADVFMTDYPYSQRFLANAEWARLVSPTTTYHVTPYAYAMKFGDDAWFDYVQQFVARAKRDGILRSAAQRNGLEPILAK